MKKIFTLSFFFLLSTNAVFAQPGAITPTPRGPGVETRTADCDATFCLQNPFKGGGNLFDLLKTIINNIILPIGGVLAVLAFIYSGFLYVMAQGNSTKIAEANNALLNTVIGTAVLLGSWVLVGVIQGTINQLI